MKGTFSPRRILSIDLSVTWIFKTLVRVRGVGGWEKKPCGDLLPQRCNEEFQILRMFYWQETVKRYDTWKPTRPLGKHLRFLKEVFNGIDFYCSPNSVKTLTGLLTYALKHGEEEDFSQILDLIHRRTCALNFDKLLICTQLRLDLRLFCLFYSSHFLLMPLMT